MKKQTVKENPGEQEPWVNVYTHKCDQDPLLTNSLASTRCTVVALYCSAQRENGWYFMV